MTQHRHTRRIRDERLGVSAFCDEANQLFQDLLQLKRTHFSAGQNASSIALTSSVNQFSDYFANRFSPVQCIAEVLPASMLQKHTILDQSAREFGDGMEHFQTLRGIFDAARGMGGLSHEQSHALARMEQIVESLEGQVKGFIAQRAGHVAAASR